MNWERAMNHIGDTVIATDTVYGTYIGILTDLHRHLTERAEIRILACVEYPKQKAILQDTIKRRFPFKYCELERFDLGTVDLVGEVPSYDESVQKALKKAIEKAVGKEKEILLQHYKGGKASE